MSPYSAFLGIDQTGAVDQNGVPRPLPICYLAAKGSGSSKNNIHDFSIELDYLRRLEPQVIWDRWPGKNAAIIMDCVLGLPKDLNKDWRAAVHAAVHTEGFGRKAARDFFRELEGSSRKHRAIELKLSANSVFQEHPFQKNIQTGTFRLWKEIGMHGQQVHVPWVEPPLKSRRRVLPVFEGYPSWVWKTLLRSPKRDPGNLSSLMKRAGFSLKLSARQRRLIAKDPNLADALVLALAGYAWLNQERSRPPNPEGWILGGDR